MASRRALHFVFKIGNRKETAAFYKDVLGMKVLRHEEFEKGCDAACNGPYDGKWSKTMVGFGAENTHFAVELTYNYGIGSYKLGNDFQGITIQSDTILQKAKEANLTVKEENGCNFIESPDGHRFFVQPASEARPDPVKKVTLSSSNLKRSLEYWRDKCGMTVFSEDTRSALLGFGTDQCCLELKDIGCPVDHATAFGRIAFSCPREQLPVLEKTMKDSGETILTPLISLDTPGKATVEVVILADPDGHEICFVGDTAFWELAQVDPDSGKLLEEAIVADKSDEWFKKKGKTKAVAAE